MLKQLFKYNIVDDIRMKTVSFLIWISRSGTQTLRVTSVGRSVGGNSTV